MTIASLLQQNFTIRAFARRLYGSASTMQRELKRNSCVNGYASAKTQGQYLQRRRTGRSIVKLHSASILCGLVQSLLRMRWSPQQISVTLASLYSKDHLHRVSPETIYNCIYAMPMGELRR